MSNIEAAIYSKLSSAGPLTALVGDRISPNVATQGANFPLLVFTKLRSESDQPMGMAAGLFASSFRFDVWANTPEDAIAIRNIVQSTLDGFAGTVSGVRIDGILFEDEAGPFFDPETRVFRETIDFLICHN